MCFGGERGVAGRQGFEPRYAAPEAAVLPLDDLPMGAFTLPNRRAPALGAGSVLRQR